MDGAGPLRFFKDILLSLSTALPAEGPCVCGIRPEHLFVVDGSVTPDVRFSGLIDLKESLGSDTLYHIQYGPRFNIWV